MTRAIANLADATRTFYAELDADDPGVFESRLAADAVFAFNDVDPVAGMQAVACSLLDFTAERITGWRVYVDTSRLT
jgi:hypothetical protein